MKAVIRKILSIFVPSLDPDTFKKTIAGRPPAEIFETIYRKNVWGGRLSRGYHSGTGSRNHAVVEPYVAAVSRYLNEWPGCTVVDMGCGDFYVGFQMVKRSPRVRQWVCCDIFPGVIKDNRKKFSRPNLTFRVVDAIEDKLPTCDIIIVRQVLQHLSNAHIAKIVLKLSSYKAAIITEHLPIGIFEPNIDKETGPDHRPSFNSGIVLTKPPFNLLPKSEEIICEVESEGGIIRTTVYSF